MSDNDVGGDDDDDSDNGDDDGGDYDDGSHTNNGGNVVVVMVQFLTSSQSTYGSKGRWWSQTQILSQTELSHHHRNTTQSQHDEVWDKKCRCGDKEK